MLHYECFSFNHGTQRFLTLFSNFTEWGLVLVRVRIPIMFFIAICNINLKCPQNMSEVSAQNTPQINYYIILKMPILSGSRNTVLPSPFSRIGLCFTACSSDTLLKNICSIIMLKSCILNHISINF